MAPPAFPEGLILDCSISVQPGWPDPCTALASHTPGSKTEIWAGVNPANPANVVLGAKDLNPESSADCVWNGVFVTLDGGKTWTDVVIGGTYADRGPESPFFGYACNTDPMFAFAADGALYFNVEMYNLGGEVTGEEPFATGLGVNPLGGNIGSKLVLAKSTDGGLSWPQLTIADLGDGAVIFHDYSRLRVNPASGSVHLMINTFSNAGAIGNIITSRDGGMSVDVPVKVTPSSDPGSAFSADIAISPEGSVVLAQTAGSSPLGPNPGELYVARSTDDGRSFSDPELVLRYVPMPARLETNEFRTGTFFALAYDVSSSERAGRLYAAWADYASGNADILIASSDDDGASWSAPVRVNDDATPNDQFHPALAVDGEGSVHLAFFDRRHDPQNRLMDVTHAVSRDGGMTWSNRRVTSSAFDGDLGEHQDGFPFIGDYIGIAAAGSDVWIGYPDTRTGAAVAAAAHVAGPR